MNFEEMTLAVHVYNLARDIRKANASREKDSQGNEDSFNDFLLVYARSHPVAEFVPEAMKRLNDTCAAMRAWTAANPG